MEIKPTAFELTPTTAMTTTPFAIQVYTLTLTNNGTTEDTFDLTYAATDTSDLTGADPDLYDWQVEIPVSVTVGANLSETVNVTVSIPFNEVNWVTHTLNITATSASNSTTGNSKLTTYTGGYWVSDRPGPGGPGYAGCRFDINYGGDIDAAQDIQSVVARYPRTDQPAYDYNHSGDIDAAQDIQKVVSKYSAICPSP
jgi:hypothetical protein